MTDTEMRIAVAEAMGWIFHIWEQEGDYMNCHLCKMTTLSRPLPLACNKGWNEKPADYPTNLDACAELENALRPVEWNLYTSYLEAVTRRTPTAFEEAWEDINPSRFIDACLVHATAKQKCEAFLRVKGLWKEGAR